MLQPNNSPPPPPRSPQSTALQITPPTATAPAPALTPSSSASAVSGSTASSSYLTSAIGLPQPVQFQFSNLSPRYGPSSHVFTSSSSTAPSSPFLSPPRSERASAATSPHFRSPHSSKKRMSRSTSLSSSMRHADVASVTSLNYSNLYSPPHNLYSHLYSQSSSSSTLSSTASSLSFQPARTYPSSSFLPAFASIHTSPDSTSHDLSAPPSPQSVSRSHTFGVGAGGLAGSGLLRTLQPLEAFPASLRALPAMPPSLPLPTLPPQPAYPPSIVQVTEDKDEARTPTAELDEQDPELASLSSSSSSFSLSRTLPSTPTMSRFRPARSPSITERLPPLVARDDFPYVELDPREPLPVWHSTLRAAYPV